MPDKVRSGLLPCLITILRVHRMINANNRATYCGANNTNAEIHDDKEKDK